jgi:Arc/MetJ-type ribon-helix-helix transcriptional regulator
MAASKIAISIDQKTLKKLDRLVKNRSFPSRSKAIQDAVEEKLKKLEKGRLARECAKLDPDFEKALAEEGSAEEVNRWPEQIYSFRISFNPSMIVSVSSGFNRPIFLPSRSLASVRIWLILTQDRFGNPDSTSS